MDSFGDFGDLAGLSPISCVHMGGSVSSVDCGGVHTKSCKGIHER